MGVTEVIPLLNIQLATGDGNPLHPLAQDTT